MVWAPPNNTDIREQTEAREKNMHSQIRTQGIFSAEKYSQSDNNLNLSSSILMAMNKTKYNLGPHTDVARKLVTLILYFAEDDSKKHLGTSIYIPKNRDFHMLNSPHLNYEDFDLVKTLEYKPNSAFMFVVGGNSFHGVEPIDEVTPKRQLIQYQIVQ